MSAVCSGCDQPLLTSESGYCRACRIARMRRYRDLKAGLRTALQQGDEVILPGTKRRAMVRRVSSLGVVSVVLDNGEDFQIMEQHLRKADRKVVFR